MSSPTLRLYDFWESGNCYKVRLLLAQLGIPYERVPVDILAGETRTPAFLAKNPNGRVPLVEWPDGRRLAESNAMLCYLGEGTRYVPADRWERGLHFAPRFLQSGAWLSRRAGGLPNLAPSRPLPGADQPTGSRTMMFLEALGPSLSTMFLYFGVLMLSLAIAAASVLEDY